MLNHDDLNKALRKIGAIRYNKSPREDIDDPPMMRLANDSSESFFVFKET